MSLVALVIALVVVGFALWLIETFIPMNAKVKLLLEVLVVVVLLLWVLQGFGIITGMSRIRI